MCGKLSCNALNYLSNKIYVPGKTEDLNLHIFNMITGMNESKTINKHVSWEYKRKDIGKKRIRIKSVIKINVSVNANIQKNIMCMKKTILGILLNLLVKMTFI